MSRKPYTRPLSNTTWYLRQGRYRVYMLRELTCVLVGFYTVLLIFALAALAENSASHWNTFLATQRSTTMVTIHAIALVYFLLYQTFAWFELAPKAMPIQMGEKKVPDRYIVIVHYIAWALISTFLFWLLGVF